MPFSEGDEVHVHIVEPHMYNDDDAVAKVDGYMIEVVNAIPYVGEKKLVLIEEAGRTGARAVLVGAEAEEAADAGRRPRQGDQGARPPAGAHARQAQGRPEGEGAADGRPEARGRVRGARERRRRGRRGGNARIEASAPRPQRRTAPFACQGRSQRVSADTMPPETTTDYAVIRTGGKQYRVEEGMTLLVERLPDDEGAKIVLEPLLYSGGKDTLFESSDLGRVKVEATILGHERGEKLRVFKFKPKRGYKRTAGHRQELTRLQVTGISVGRGASGVEEEDRRGGREWLIRRGSAPAATAATPSPSASA